MSSPDLVGHEKDAIQDQLEDGPSRYAAYLMRLRTLITASSRYIAYSSDIGEAFRPLTSDAFVRSAYAVSWAYLALDVGYTGYKAHLAQHQSLDPLKPVHDAVAAAKGKAGQIDVANDPTLSKSHSEATNIGLVVARRAVFQSIASMALPAFTIHSIVRYTAPVFAKASSARIRSAGPTIAGLAFVPALPFVFDEPVEHVVDAAFDFVESKWNPQAAKEGVGKSTEDAKEHIVQAAESLKKTGAEMEKEALKAKDGLLSLVGAGDDTPADKTTSAIQKAMLLGIGVDVLYLPRMRGMLQRQARRMAPGLKMAASASTTTAIQPATVQAGMRLAEKIGSERERREFRRLFVDSRVGLQAAWQRELPDNGRAIRWLALRWTAKEAAYKALYPHIQLRWSDLDVSRQGVSGEAQRDQAAVGVLAKEALSDLTKDAREEESENRMTGNKPTLAFSTEFKDAWKERLSTKENKSDEEKKIELHLSISHDGDVCIANVVAELVDATRQTPGTQWTKDVVF